MKRFLETVKIELSASRISARWCETLDVLNESNYVKNRYKAIHQIRDKRKVGVILNSLRLDPGQIFNKCRILRCSA